MLKYDTESVNKEMTKGLPQGSVPGPLLWNITFDALLLKEFPLLVGVEPIAFADNVAFIIPGDTRRQVEAVGNQTMDILPDWDSETNF